MPEIDKQGVKDMYSDLSQTPGKSGRWVRGGDRIWWDRLRHQAISEEMIAQGVTEPLVDAGLVMVAPMQERPTLDFFAESATLGLPQDWAERLTTEQLLREIARGSGIHIEVAKDKT